MRPNTKSLIIAGSDTVSYGFSQTSQTHRAVRACHLLRASSVNTTVWLGEFLEVEAPPDLLKDSPLAIEPRTDSVSSGFLKSVHAWPHPDIIQAVGGKLRLLNDTEEPLLVRNNDHFCQARHVVSDPPPKSTPIKLPSSSPSKPTPAPNSPRETVRVDPDGLLSASEKASFASLLK